MIIGSIKEFSKEETRTALTPDVAKTLSSLGHTILLEKDIGKKSHFSNQQYLSSNVIFKDKNEIYQKSDILLQITPPQNNQINTLNSKQILISDFSNFNFSNISTPATFIRLEKVPRTSIAQSIDILSSQHTIRGYSASISALYYSSRIAPQLFTASTSIPQSKALIIGASITGLQAASTLKRNGVDVTIADIDNKKEELAKSVGASFINSTDITQHLDNKNFIITAVGGLSSPTILNLDTLKKLTSYPIIIDTTPNNINILKNTLSTPSFFFKRNPYFERLFPTSATHLLANNMLNLITTITSSNNIDLSQDYIKPMLFKVS